MWPSKRHGNRRGGITLVEVLVALTVLSVGILGLLSSLLLSSNVSARGQHMDGAVALANTRLEQAVSVKAEQLEAQQGQDDRYSYTLSIENRSGGLMAAKMTVQWLEGGSVQEYTISKVFLPVQVQEEADQ